jgi:XTP/dITP diphosphohydrolase
MFTLLLGTSNRGKVAELTELFAASPRLGSRPFLLVSLADVTPAAAEQPLVEETGRTLAENAALKAIGYARRFGMWTLADDTALEVDALNGSPGLHTARYAGPTATASENRRRVLAELAAAPLGRRTAQFTCCLTLADSSGSVRATSEGRCRGRIRLTPAGDGGFGYDPLFELIEYRLTFAELGPAAKQALSHRARAAAAMARQFASLDL